MRDMTNQEAIEMMNRCKHEITDLKVVIARLQPKADAYDNMAQLLAMLPRPSVGMGEDLVRVLEKRIRELTPPPPAKNEPSTDVSGREHLL